MRSRPAPPEVTFRRFPADAALAPWVDAAEVRARAALEAPDLARWWRAGGTWFVGVDALPNDTAGRMPGGPSPRGAAIDAARAVANAPWHRLQLSCLRPGYPRIGAEEDAAQHRFRLKRDGAHLDGLLPEGPRRRRHLREPHAFILGIALTEADPGASPLVVWEGSEKVLLGAIGAAFEGVPPGSRGDVDLTEVYAAARRAVFESCARVPVPLARGEAVLLHRAALHGIAPWAAGALADPAGRAIAYLRPPTTPGRWLAAP
ncbi:MAG: hypothetical protein QNJ13_16825 [Paracoccaceae bacterium]|nr:hypothetical protein [Paracoccaceae bacterium]